MEHNQKLEAMRREYLNERQELSIRLVSAVQNQEVKPDSSVTDSSAKPAKPPPPPPSHHDTITGKPFFFTSLSSQLTWPFINQKNEIRLIILFANSCESCSLGCRCHGPTGSSCVPASSRGGSCFCKLSAAASQCCCGQREQRSWVFAVHGNSCCRNRQLGWRGCFC